MVVTNDLELPTYEELTVEEVPISSPGLRAAAHHFGNFFFINIIIIIIIVTISISVPLMFVDNCILGVYRV